MIMMADEENTSVREVLTGNEMKYHGLHQSPSLMENFFFISTNMSMNCNADFFVPNFSRGETNGASFINRLFVTYCS